MRQPGEMPEPAQRQFDSHAARLAELQAVEGGTAAEQAARSLQIADLLRFLGRIADSEARFAALAQADLGSRLRILAEVGLANASCARADWDAARRRLEAILDNEAAWGFQDPALAARVRATMASALYNEHRFSEARAQLEAALGVLRQHGDREGEAIAVTSLGIVALALSDTSAAFALLDEGCATARRVGLPRWEGMALSYLAMTRHLSGDLATAATTYDASLEVLGRLGLRRAEGLAHFGRAMLRVEMSLLDAAGDDLHDALFNERVASPDYEPLLAAALALIAAARHDETAARHHLNYAQRCLGEQGRRFAAEVTALEAGIVAKHATPFTTCVTPESRLLARAMASLQRLRLAPRLMVDSEGVKFRVEPGELVDLTRRKSLRRIFQGLLASHAQPAQPALSIEDLIRLGWPGQRVISASGATRVYTAVATLRRLGLEGLLERRGEGYALVPSCVVQVQGG